MWRTVIVALSLIALTQANASPEGSPAIVSHIPRESVKSSGIAAIGYSKRLRALEVEFLNGAVYRYLDVPRDVYRNLMQASSKARFYDQQVRGHYLSVHVAKSARR